MDLPPVRALTIRHMQMRVPERKALNGNELPLSYCAFKKVYKRRRRVDSFQMATVVTSCSRTKAGTINCTEQNSHKKNRNTHTYASLDMCTFTLV